MGSTGSLSVARVFASREHAVIIRDRLAVVGSESGEEVTGRGQRSHDQSYPWTAGASATSDQSVWISIGRVPRRM